MLEYRRFAEDVLAEDIGRGDLFERIGESKEAAARIIAKSEGVLAGVPYVEAICALQDLQIDWQKGDGERFEKGDLIARIFGDSVKLLQAERAILNTVLHASGIAAQARRFVEAAGEKLKILDTRKTRPKLRVFEKYAARVGGVVNHRLGLDDCLMLKDTHLRTIDDLQAFLQKARRAIPFTAKIEIECEDVAMARRAMEAGADIVMCDNMDIDAIKEVVALRNASYPHVLLEASGNITLETLAQYATLGIDAVSSGSIIHQATWPDISMKMDAL